MSSPQRARILTNKRPLLLRHPTFALLLTAAAAALISLATGSAEVPVFKGLGQWLSGQNTAAAIVIGEIRLPRTLLALLVGACLGLAGAALQALLRNPLADPGLTGASGGAALGAALVFYFGPSLGWLGRAAEFGPVIAGLVGAAAALLAVLALALSAQSAQLILAGLAVSTLTGSLLAVTLNFAPNPYAMQELVFWLLGSVSERGIEHVGVLLIALVLGGTLVWHERALLSALSLGESVAQTLGFDIRAGTRRTILACALLVGAAVSVAGSIGFVGLIVPHLVRPLVHHRPEKTLLPSALAGGTLLLAADILVRCLPPAREVKLGVITTLIGAPLLILLIARGRRQWL